MLIRRIYLSIAFFLSVLLALTECAHYPVAPTLNPPLSNAQKNAIFERMRTEINSYLGVPYRIGGLSMKGMDCSGLVWRVYHDAAGIELPRSSNNMHLIGESVQYGKWNFGDLLFFSINDKKITHVGIYIGANRFVHVSISDGTIISSLEEPYYEMSYKGARRIIR